VKGHCATIVTVASHRIVTRVMVSCNLLATTFIYDFFCLLAYVILSSYGGHVSRQDSMTFHVNDDEKARQTLFGNSGPALHVSLHKYRTCLVVRIGIPVNNAIYHIQERQCLSFVDKVGADPVGCGLPFTNFLLDNGRV